MNSLNGHERCVFESDPPCEGELARIDDVYPPAKPTWWRGRSSASESHACARHMPDWLWEYLAENAPPNREFLLLYFVFIGILTVLVLVLAWAGVI